MWLSRSITGWPFQLIAVLLPEKASRPPGHRVAARAHCSARRPIRLALVGLDGTLTAALRLCCVPRRRSGPPPLTGPLTGRAPLQPSGQLPGPPPRVAHDIGGVSRIRFRGESGERYAGCEFRSGGGVLRCDQSAARWRRRAGARRRPGPCRRPSGHALPRGRRRHGTHCAAVRPRGPRLLRRRSLGGHARRASREADRRPGAAGAWPAPTRWRCRSAPGSSTSSS